MIKVIISEPFMTQFLTEGNRTEFSARVAHGLPVDVSLVDAEVDQTAKQLILYFDDGSEELQEREIEFVHFET